MANMNHKQTGESGIFFLIAPTRNIGSRVCIGAYVGLYVVMYYLALLFKMEDIKRVDGHGKGRE